MKGHSKANQLHQELLMQGIRCWIIPLNQKWPLSQVKAWTVYKMTIDQSSNGIARWRTSDSACRQLRYSRSLALSSCTDNDRSDFSFAAVHPKYPKNTCRFSEVITPNISVSPNIYGYWWQWSSLGSIWSDFWASCPLFPAACPLQYSIIYILWSNFVFPCYHCVFCDFCPCQDRFLYLMLCFAYAIWYLSARYRTQESQNMQSNRMSWRTCRRQRVVFEILIHSNSFSQWIFALNRQFVQSDYCPSCDLKAQLPSFKAFSIQHPM